MREFGSGEDLDIPSLSLRIVGDGDPIPVPFAADGTFSVPRNQAALDDNADEALIELQFEPELTAEQKAHPWEQPLYLMGSMNHWGPRTRLHKMEDGVFKAQVELSTGRHEFKVGGNHFIGADLGGAGKAKQTLATENPVALATRGSNLVLNVTTAGSYDFMLDAHNVAAPVLTVTRSIAPQNNPGSGPAIGHGPSRNACYGWARVRLPDLTPVFVYCSP